MSSPLKQPLIATLGDVQMALQSAGLPRVRPTDWATIRAAEPADRLRDALRRAPMDPGARTYLEGLVAPACQHSTRRPEDPKPSPSFSPTGAAGPVDRPRLDDCSDSTVHHSIHVYGGKSALCFDADTTRAGVPTVALDAASGGNRRYDWSSKTRLQLTQQELPIVSTVLMGFRRSCEYRNHGPNADKGFSMERQRGGRVFVRVYAKAEGVKAVPIDPAELYYVAGLFLRQLTLATPWIDGTGIIAILRSTAGEHG